MTSVPFLLWNISAVTIPTKAQTEFTSWTTIYDTSHKTKTNYWKLTTYISQLLWNEVLLWKITDIMKLAFASWTLDKEADEIKQCCVSVASICINPVIHHSLSQNKPNIHIIKICLNQYDLNQLKKNFVTFQEVICSRADHAGRTCIAFLPMLTTSNSVTASTSPFLSCSFSALPRLPLLLFECFLLAFSEHSRAFLFPLYTWHNTVLN